MIQNEKQYLITKDKLRDVKARITVVSRQNRGEPLKQQLVLASLENFAKELETEIADYEASRANLQA